MENETSIGLIVGLGSLALVFFVLLLAIITSAFKRKIVEKEKKLRVMEQQKQIDLFKAMADTEEKEKFRIAALLHDEIVPMIALASRSVNFQITELEKQGISVEGLKEDITAFGTLATRVREIAHDIIPQLFTTFGLLKSIEAFVNKMSSKESLAEFHNNTLFTEPLPFSDSEQLIIYTMCLEILNNLLKHGKYNLLTVTLEDMKQNFNLVFAHDGISITNDQIKKLAETGQGMGLKNLQSKALLLNAQIDYSNELGVSYVKLFVPLKK